MIFTKKDWGVFEVSLELYQQIKNSLQQAYEVSDDGKINLILRIEDDDYDELPQEKIEMMSVYMSEMFEKVNNEMLTAMRFKLVYADDDDLDEKVNDALFFQKVYHSAGFQKFMQKENLEKK